MTWTGIAVLAVFLLVFIGWIVGVVPWWWHPFGKLI